ncbi:hypothetical protein EVB32_283 [Rhizobium phage RHph_TM39]|nr:hypothetical protein EVB32_283 [Rhizobium phage RHph_TM39]QIG77549.1 hypothetical protein EVB61_238 [Rhizobium phage RHph_TM21B]
MNKMTFDDWCDQVDTVASKAMGGPESYTKATGRECWMDMYNDGFTPEDAWTEESLCIQESL